MQLLVAFCIAEVCYCESFILLSVFLDRPSKSREQAKSNFSQNSEPLVGMTLPQLEKKFREKVSVLSFISTKLKKRRKNQKSCLSRSDFLFFGLILMFRITIEKGITFQKSYDLENQSR